MEAGAVATDHRNRKGRREREGSEGRLETEGRRGRKDAAKAASSRAARAVSDPPITLSEQDGVRYLHFGSEWVQGTMAIGRPWHIEIDYVAQMMAWLLFLDPPKRILQLGLGAGALTRWCWSRLPRYLLHL